MKKSKNDKRSSADFNNSPFQSLKGKAPPSGPLNERARTRAARSQREMTQENEQAVFLRAIEGVRRIGNTRGSPDRSSSDQKGAVKRPLETEENQLFLSAIQKIKATVKDRPEADETDRRLSRSRMHLTRRDAVHITRELDLHGFLRDEALQRLHSFIVNAYSQGQTAVLVITGKGLNSPEGPVLQGAVDAWLRNQGRGMVAEFSPAPRSRGGKGAFVVVLKKN
jgi:DNA-nicking Smr family endonuclease